MKEQNFAKLFRSSQFAKFDPTIPRIYAASLHPITGVTPISPATKRPAFFGFKRDLHPTHYGRPLEYVQMKTMDGDYGQCAIRNAEDERRIQLVVSELQRLLGGSGNVKNDKAKDSKADDFHNRPLLCPSGVKVPGRLLDRLDNGGYAVGIAGVIAELPPSELPALVHFSNRQLLNKNAYYFYLLSAHYDTEHKKARVILSLKAPQ